MIVCKEILYRCGIPFYRKIAKPFNTAFGGEMLV